MPLITSVLLIILSVFGLTHCEGPRYYDSAEMAQLEAQPELVVLIIKHPLSYSSQGPRFSHGIDYDLLSDFARRNNKKIRFRSFQNEDDLVAAFKQGEGHIAAGRFPRSFAESHNNILGPDYESASLSVFCRTRVDVQKSQDLDQRKLIVFEKNKSVLSYTDLIKDLPKSEVQVWLNGSTPRAFQELTAKNADCLITNHIEGVYHLKDFRNVEFKFKLKDHFSLNWMIQESHGYLSPIMRSWFQIASREGRIQKIYDRYKGYSEELKSSDIEIFKQRTRSRLPEFKKYFQIAARDHYLPWELVAAVGYQESHWDASARSFTGVQGIMQITKSTAKTLGIEDIHDPEENIRGGARYLRKLISLLPAEISYSDRVTLALAAYNIGIGHLQDAMNIAFEMGLNPYHWNDLKKALPRLTQPQYYKKTQFGRARGYETIEYVEKTKAYFHYLLNNY